MICRWNKGDARLKVQCQSAYILIPRSQKGKDGLRDGEC
jgi:hypothetical protein